MPDLLLVSSVLLWLVVLALLFVVLALARQIGVLHERLAPAGAAGSAHGVREGELVPAMTLTDISGRSLTIGGAQPRGMLVLFVSPTCPVCRVLAPAAADAARRDGLDLLFASEGRDVDAHRRYAAAQGLEAPYVLAPELVRAHDVGMLPFALVLDASGVLRSKGRVDDAVELQRLLGAASPAGVQVFQPAAAAGSVTTTEGGSS